MGRPSVWGFTCHENAIDTRPGSEYPVEKYSYSIMRFYYEYGEKAMNFRTFARNSGEASKIMIQKNKG
jgi:hypothetical protein